MSPDRATRDIDFSRRDHPNQGGVPITGLANKTKESMKNSNPNILILIGFSLEVLVCLILILTATSIVNLSFFLNLSAYGLALTGLVLGFLGVVRSAEAVNRKLAAFQKK